MKNNKIWKKGLTVGLSAFVAVSMVPSTSIVALARRPASDVTADADNQTAANQEATADNQTAANQEATTHYVTMNVPYTDFYAAYNLTDKAVWEVEPGLDAVSTATTSKFAGTTGLAKGTYNNGTYIMGVTLPVEVSAEDYAKLNTGLTNTDNYYFTETAQTPVAYSTLTIGADGKYQFSKLQDAKIDTSGLGIVEYTDESDYGDYQISLKGFANSKYEKGAGLIVGDTMITDYSIYGAILHLNDGTYGMTCLENLWYGNKTSAYFEIAWSIKEGKQLERAHGNGGLFYQFKDVDAAELKSVDVITSLGVISIDKGDALKKLTEYYPGDLSKLAYSISADSTDLQITGIPTDLKGVSVSLSYKEGRAAAFLAEKAQVVDGKVTLTGKPVDGTKYTLSINNDEYPAISRAVSTPVASAQKTELESLVKEAENASGYADNADLKQHVQEAKDIIAKGGSSADAAELIGELQEKIKATQPKAQVKNASLKGNVLAVSLDKTDLKNASFALTVQAGRATTTLASGSLTGASVTIDANPEVGTEYTLTITSDNYQAATTTVTAEEAAAVEPATPAVQTTKKAQNLTVKAVNKTYKVKTLKKKAQSFKALTVKSAQGKLTYSAKFVNSKSKKALKFDKKTGKITVKKGTKKGTYQVKVTVKAAAKGNYKASKSYTKTVKVTVK